MESHLPSIWNFSTPWVVDGWLAAILMLNTRYGDQESAPKREKTCITSLMQKTFTVTP